MQGSLIIVLLSIKNQYVWKPFDHISYNTKLVFSGTCSVILFQVVVV